MRLKTFSDLAIYVLEFLEVELHELDLVEISFLNLVEEWRELFFELIYRRIQFINRLLIIIFCCCRILLRLGAYILEISDLALRSKTLQGDNRTVLPTMKITEYPVLKRFFTREFGGAEKDIIPGTTFRIHDKL